MPAKVTRAAEGFDRRPFTGTKVLPKQDAGVVTGDESFELIEGEIAPTRLFGSHSSTGSPTARARARSPSWVRRR